MRHARTPRGGGQNWATFLQNHANDMWACDALAGHRPLLSLAGRLSSFSICTLEESFMWVSHGLLPVPGRHNNCGRRLPMDNRRTISFAIVIPNLDPVRARVAASSGIKMLTTPHHAPRANATCERFLAACVESVSIILSSSGRSNCIVSCMPMSSTSIEPDRIKASHNRSQNSMVSLSLRITMVARSSPSQSWVACTTITARFA
jgi:hypothetical protein